MKRLADRLPEIIAGEIRGAATVVAAGTLGLCALAFASVGKYSVIAANILPYMAVPLLLLAVVLFMARSRWRSVLFALPAVLCLVYVMTVGRGIVQVAAGEIEAQATLKVIAFNILGTNHANGERIAEFLLDTDPDVAFIEEARPLQPYMKELEERFPYRVGCGALTRWCDLLLLSKRPLVEPRLSGLSAYSPDRFILAGIDAGGTEVTLAGIHLTKPNFAEQQATEYRAMRRRVPDDGRPLIMAGDFNTATWSRDFVGMAKALGLKVAANSPGTWPIEAGRFGVPIDHILVRPPLRITSMEALPDTFGSNHRGLVAEIAVGRPSTE